MLKLSLSLIALACAVALSGCGLQNQVDELKHNQNVTNERIDDLEVRFTGWTTAIANLYMQVTMLEAKFDLTNNELKKTINTLYDNQSLSEDKRADLLLLVNTLSSQLTTLETEMADVNATSEALQAQANAQQIQITQLQMNTTISSLIDPCGNSPGYDEVLIKLSTGQVVAYFEDKGKRHLTVLTPGASYETTDDQACAFKVDSSGVISYN